MPESSAPKPPQALEPPTPAPLGDPDAGRFRPGDPSLRRRTARGTIVNAVFLAGLNLLGLLKGFIVAAFLTRSEYGVWGILLIALGTLLWLKQVGIGDKYVQQDEADQERAFQKAFTFELLVAGVLLGLMLASLPIFVLLYGESELLLPGAVLTLVVPALALQSPTWIFYRRMDFVRQRTLQAVDPLATFVVTIALAIAGLDYWSLVLGVVIGTWAGALAALAASPYRLALRFERETARAYLSFSWPVLVASLSGIVIAQLSLLLSEAELGLAGAGAVTLAASLSAYAEKVDAIVTGTLYPAICAVRDRTELLFESFVKSNRLALMWGLPFGVGLALFAPDLVRFGIGEEWTAAIGVIQAFGLIAAVNHIGFNWDSFFWARDDTRPTAVVGVITVAAFLASTVPLIFAYGLRGFIAGMAITTAVSLLARTFYLTRLFPGLAMLAHSARAMAPTVPAVLATLAVRAAAGERTLGLALVELGVYLAVTAASTFVFERALLREVAGYLRGQRRPQATLAG